MSDNVADEDVRQLISTLTNIDAKARWNACYEKYDTEYKNLEIFKFAEKGKSSDLMFYILCVSATAVIIGVIAVVILRIKRGKN